MADVVRARLLYTGFALEEGEAGDGAGKGLEGSTWSEEEWKMVENLDAKTEAQLGEAASRRMARTGRTILYRLLAAAEICILFGVIVLFNVFPERVGLYSSAVVPYLFVPLLTLAWLPYVPWLNLWWGLALILALVKLVYGRWTQALRWADLGVHLLGIVILASVILGGGFAGPESVGASVDNAASAWVRQQPDLLAMGFKAGLVLVLVALVVGFFDKLAKLGIPVPILQWRFDGSKR